MLKEFDFSVVYYIRKHMIYLQCQFTISAKKCMPVRGTCITQNLKANTNKYKIKM